MVFFSLILFVLFIWGVLQITVVQNYLVGKVTTILSEKLHARVQLKHINYHFFDKIAMDSLLVKDQQKDTLVFAGNARVNITDWFFIKDKTTLKYLGLDDAIVNLQRTDSTWNYQFLVDYFGGKKVLQTAQKELSNWTSKYFNLKISNSTKLTVGLERT